MSDAARRVFKIEVILDLVSGKIGDGVTEMLAFSIGRDLSLANAVIVVPLVKAWIYTQLPALMENPYDGNIVYEEWVLDQVRRHDSANVSILAIPKSETVAIVGLLDTLVTNQDIIDDQTAKIEEMEDTIKKLKPFKDMVRELKKKIEQQEDSIANLEGKVRELNAATIEYKGKIPVAANEINQTIKNIVTNAFKDAMISMQLSVPGSVAAVSGETVAVAAFAVAEEAFGLGMSEPDSDGFGF
ncbi:conserved hypothetical protein [Desulfovibrionales bacterium]